MGCASILLSEFPAPPTSATSSGARDRDDPAHETPIQGRTACEPSEYGDSVGLDGRVFLVYTSDRHAADPKMAPPKCWLTRSGSGTRGTGARPERVDRAGPQVLTHQAATDTHNSKRVSTHAYIWAEFLHRTQWGKVSGFLKPRLTSGHAARESFRAAGHSLTAQGWASSYQYRWRPQQGAVLAPPVPDRLDPTPLAQQLRSTRARDADRQE